MANLQAGYGLDQDGNIVSEVGIDKIDIAYLPCIQECVEKLVKSFSHHLHSVYVYGSVARGEAIKGKSDLDLIVMFNGGLTSEKSTELKTLSDTLFQKYRSLVRDVGIAVADLDYTVDPANYYEGAFLREISVCVYGEDLRVKFGPYKLSPEISISFNGDIGDVVSRTIRRLHSASGDEFKKVSQGFARKLIRTYYSMVMVRSEIWTTRLHEQAEVVMQYFPQKERVIRSLQAWLEEAPTNHEQVLNLIECEGKWVTENFEREARTPS